MATVQMVFQAFPTLLLLLVMMLTVGNDATASKNALSQLTKSVNEFNYAFLQQVAVGKASSAKGENAFFSGFSMATTLAMLIEGARGKTQAELLSGLKLSNQETKLTHEQFKEALAALKLRNSDNKLESSIANKMFLANGYSLLREFQDIVNNKYQASVDVVDFGSEGSKVLKNINDWVSQQTRGRIQKIFEGELDPLTRLVLVNAIYFKGSWEEAFNATHTKLRTFYNNGVDANEVEFMYKKAIIKSFYGDDNGFRVFELPYKGNASMVIVLPNEKNGLDSVIEQVSPQQMMAAVEEVTLDRFPEESEVFLPKFKLATSYDLTDILPKIGIQKIFDQSSADLSGIDGTHDLYVSDAVHKAAIEVNEEGTVASGVTAVVIQSRGLFIRPIFLVDRPFLFFIRDNLTGMTLFTGRINQL